ncbi:MAG TPA: Uma2 family endonuclease [Oceanobacillus sp.]|nr:Uma2 family endonuclease [Oceanobacillus sp.]
MMEAEQLSGQIIATNTTWDDYMEHHAADFAEWVDGVVIKMAPVRLQHHDLSAFLFDLFRELLRRTGGGKALIAPFVMRLAKSSREPDVQVVLPANLARIKDTYVDGPADLVVEIISPDSDTRDRVEKFSEYQAGGVPEYWILDPIYEETLFYQRDEKGLFRRIQPDENGVYHSAVLPQLALPVEVLWRPNLPDGEETRRMVEAMLGRRS